MSLLGEARSEFLKSINERIVYIQQGKYGATANFADKDSKKSVLLAAGVSSRLPGTPATTKLTAQGTGSAFEGAVRDFLEKSMPALGNLRPGDWLVWQRSADHEEAKVLDVSAFEQYRHLALLAERIETDAELKSIMGPDYMIRPDVVVGRLPVSDGHINSGREVVDDSVGKLSGLRKRNNNLPLLHASISCKWTMRSDRSQNSRTEALNLIRNRKGNVPHIVVVTMEPLPSRIASIALGTGDIDCTYHAALDELLSAGRDLEKGGHLEAGDVESLESLVDTKRLKDISDLPLDLAT